QSKEKEVLIERFKGHFRGCKYHSTEDLAAVIKDDGHIIECAKYIELVAEEGNSM
ncbi:conserved hypothetical protein, partial [Ricinus communis]